MTTSDVKKKYKEILRLNVEYRQAVDQLSESDAKEWISRHGLIVFGGIDDGKFTTHLGGVIGTKTLIKRMVGNLLEDLIEKDKDHSSTQKEISKSLSKLSEMFDLLKKIAEED